MGVLDVIRKRKSVRKYKSDSIPEDVLMRVLEAARLAPSAKKSPTLEIHYCKG